MIPAVREYMDDKASAPRACGDDPVKGKLQIPYYECSPRMRG